MKTKTLLLLAHKLTSNDFARSDRKHLFNLICICSSSFAFIGTIVNIVAEVGISATLSSSLLSIIYFSLYLITRSKAKFKVWMPLTFLAVSYPALIYLWFLNAGHEGTIGYVLMIYILGIMCIFPKGYQFWLVGVNITVFCALLITEYIHPEWVLPYENSKNMVVDYGTSFVFIGVFMTIILRTLVRSYDEEKNNALQEKSLAEHNSEIIARQNLELQNINLLKDKLFATISHDLRSPINSLKGTLSLLQNNSLTEDEVKKLTLNISDRLYHTSNLLENLLSWSNTQLEGTKIRIKKVKISQIAEACISLYANQAQQKGITIKNEMQQHLYSFVDEDMFHSIVRNLLSNAIKFTHQNGEIVIRSWAEDEKTFLEVKDNGIGMDRNKLDQLFGALHSSSEGTALEKGIGLGLLISKDFVEKNGGSISVSSLPNQGSTFTISLPNHEELINI